MKRVSISQPVVIDTEIVPLESTFRLETNGKTEQCYDVNAGTYTPDRTQSGNALVITPKVSAYDKNTQTAYNNLSFSSVSWEVKIYEFNTRIKVWSWVIYPLGISSPAGFSKVGDTLVVTRNHNDAAHAISITCKAIYIDPRDINRTYKVVEEIALTCTSDAIIETPQISIQAPDITLFNPLSRSSSLFTLYAKSDWSKVTDKTGVDVDGFGNYGVFVWYGLDKNGQEVLIENLPCCYDPQLQHTSTMRIDAMYSENTTIILRIKKRAQDSDTTDLLPPKAQTNITWRIPPVMGIITCNNGKTVRTTDTRNFLFNTIVSTNEGVIDESLVQRHLRFNWKTRKATEAPQNSSIQIGDGVRDMGWGRSVLINAKELKNTTTTQNASKLVLNNIYMLGSLEEILAQDEPVTCNGTQVYGRSMI